MSLGDFSAILGGNTEEQRKKNLMLLGELDSLLREMPDWESFARHSDESSQWSGRLTAVLEAWDSIRAMSLAASLRSARSTISQHREHALSEIKTLLHHARYDLQMKVGVGLNAAYDTGAVFSYFDDVRKLFEQAVTDILVIDPWLDADFVSRYLPSVKANVSIRLLTSKNKLGTLLPAVDLFAQQDGAAVAVRIDDALHDRYLVIDGVSGYQSGASFKDGARKAPTTLTQIIDPFSAVRDTYERKWAAAAVAR